MMYRPEPLQKQNVPPLEYTWEALEQWITKQRESNSAFGICRLMMMHRRMQTTYTDNQMQEIFSHYRSSPRDLWSDETRDRIATTFQKEYYQCRNEDIDDDEFNISNSLLEARITEQLYKLTQFSDIQLMSLQESMPSTNNWNMLE